MRLEPAALRSRVKHSTTEPLRSPYLFSVFSGNGFTLIVLLVQPPPQVENTQGPFYIVDYLIGK